MFKAIINLFKPFKPTPVELKVEDTIKVEEPTTVVDNGAGWPFPTQAPVDKVKAKPVKKPAKPSSTIKTNSKQAPKPDRKGK